jgi:glycyl-tRNA synthetase beta chain
VPFGDNPEGFLGAFRVAISEFMTERLSFYLRDTLGFAYDTVKAVLSTRNGADDVCDTVLRAKAVSDIRDTPSFKTIAVAFKRMTNIARQARQLNLTVAAKLNPSLFTSIEKRLFDAMQPAGQRFQIARDEQNYPEALRQLSELAPNIDEFFEHVMILAEDRTLQENRLNFITRIGLDFAGVADFSEIVTDSTKASPERGERT